MKYPLSLWFDGGIPYKPSRFILIQQSFYLRVWFFGLPDDEKALG